MYTLHISVSYNNKLSEYTRELFLHAVGIQARKEKTLRFFRGDLPRHITTGL